MPIKTIINAQGIPETFDSDYRQPTVEEVKARKAFSTRCGHVKRRLKQNEPLSRKMLEFTLDEVIGQTDDVLLGGIADKLKAGQPLSDYETHIMVDVVLLHTRLGA